MKKKYIIVVLVFLLIALSSIVYYNIKNGMESSNDYVGGVDDVDFSNYTSKDISASTTITSGGIYNLSGNIEGTIVVNVNNADVKLVLNNVNITSNDGPAIYIESADNTYIELVGENTINSTTSSELNGAIYSKDDLCFVGDGKLTIVSNIDGIVGKDDLEIDSGNYYITSDDDGIVGKDSVYIKDGNFVIKSAGDAIKSSNEEEKGVITILNGTFDIDSESDGIQSISTLTIENGVFKITTGESSSTMSTSSMWGMWGNNNTTATSMKAIKSNGNIIVKDGSFNIDSEDDAIHSNASITIDGGTFNITSGDDGIHADTDLLINSGYINITKSYEGLEGSNITINGGDITVVSSDDGLNAAGGNDSSSTNRNGANAFTNKNNNTITINAGKVYVNASGDGIDSNGNIYIKGGEVYVDGPTNNGNGAMDYGDGGAYVFEVTGGTLIAVGASGMAVSPTSGTTIPSIMINLSSTYTGDITLGSVAYSPKKNFQSILICSSDLSIGNTYSLSINNTNITSVSLTNVVTINGNSNAMGGMMPGSRGNRR